MRSLFGFQTGILALHGCSINDEWQSLKPFYFNLKADADISG